MASKTLTLSNSQTFCYPPISYQTADWLNGYTEYRYANHWYWRHSDPDRAHRRYQAGNSTTDGQYNGNMMSHFFFANGGQTMNQFIKSIGGSSKITRITLTLTCGHAYYSSMDLKVCMGYSYDTVGRYNGQTADSYGGLGIDKMVDYTIPKGATRTIDLTAHKAKFDSGQTICLYCPGAYNSNYYAYGWIYGHTSATEAQKPKLTIEYTTNVAPNKPGITIHSASDSNGYYVPENFDFSIVSNGDPDNNLSSTPFMYEIYNSSGGRITGNSWTSNGRDRCNLGNYRGQSVKIRGWIRDNAGASTTNEKIIYVNSLPYWNGLGAESNSIKFTSGVTGNIYQDNVTISWPRATDGQSQHSNNLRYNVYAQIGTDKGPNGDNDSSRIATGITGTSFTFDARKINGTIVNKGDRIYLSVWVHDGLEWSSYRLVSSWIYRETPPSAPTNVAPTSGHYENTVKVTWAASSAQSGTSIKHYKVQLLDGSGTVKRTYTTTNAYYTCNELSLISRGNNFKFKVTAVNNLNTESDPGYSGVLRRNSGPTSPKNFRINGSSIYVKNTVPLVWTASVDNDGDVIKYNIYYSINNGPFQELVKGRTETSYNHDVSSLNEGTTLNYYIEAYDIFNVFSAKTYIAAKPQINIPPKAPTFTLPLANRTLYTNVPRIVFQIKESYNGNDLKVIMNVNGKEYASDIAVANFDKSKYSKNTQGMFAVPDANPLNYTNNNTIKIKVFDGLDYSPETTLTLACDAMPVSKKNTGDLITAEDINKIKAMINANRFAYSMSEINWIDGNTIANKTTLFKKYYEQAVNGVFDLNSNINGKTSSSSLKRNYSKPTIGNIIINKEVFNTIYDVIKKS